MRKLWAVICFMGLGLSTSASQAGESFQVAVASKATVVATPEVQMDVVLDKDSGLDMSLYSGADYSFLGDFVNGTKGFAKYITDNGGEVSSWTGNWGWLSGLDLGLALDPSNRLSVSFEDVLTRSQNISGTDGTNGLGGAVTPGMVNATLNYKLSMSEGKGTRTSVSLGAGYYHAFVDYALGVGTQDGYGTFTGDTVGGTLGVSQDWSMGGGFDLGLSAKGRYAVFDKVTATQFHEASFTLPYAMAMVSIPGEPDVLLPKSTAVIDSDPTMRYAKLDYSGVDVTVALNFHF